MNQLRTCRYSDCFQAKENNVCPHHSCEEGECIEAVGTTEHGLGLEDEDCDCWITCNACREWCGFEALTERDFLKDAPTTLHDVA